MSRLISELGVKLDRKLLQLWCNNQQTIRLITKEIVTLTTKLRYVDIYNHWLREVVEKGAITVDYTLTEDMLADGLTKALIIDKFRKFRKSAGIVDITELIEARQLTEIRREELEALEDY